MMEAKNLKTLLLYAGAFLLAASEPALCQVFIGSNSSEAMIPVSLPAPSGISTACNSTFSTNVTCDTSLPAIAFGGYFPDSIELGMLCNTDCLRSLGALSLAQQQSCASDVMWVDGMAYRVSATTDAMMWAFNYTCRRDAKTNELCEPIFDAWASGNASDKACSDCVLGTYQIQLQNPFGYSDDQASNFSSLTSSCRATGYPVTQPPPNTISTTRTTTAATTGSPVAFKPCSSTYTVKAGDDCHSISTSQKVSTNQMLYYNNLQGGCVDFPAVGANLCMPHTCDIYTVQANDTCFGIVAAYNSSFTVSQLVSWNIDINNGCTNLEMLVDDQICVSFPGDTPAVTATAPAPGGTMVPAPANTANGTNLQCSRYYQVKGGDTCAQVGQTLGIALADFYFLNPEVNSTSCNNLIAGLSYCVQAVGDISTYPGYGGRPTNACVGGSTAPPSSCYATTYATDSAWTFPVVNATASPTSANYTLIPITTMTPYPPQGSAAPTPTPHQDGMVDGCSRFYSVVSGDTCFDIAKRWGISLATLYSWNPALHSDCSSLQLQTYICVNATSAGTTATSTTPSTSTTSAGGGTPPPGPTQSDIAKDCNRWVLQIDGVFCFDMAQNAGISLSCLYQMNPALNTPGECQGLWPGYAYCTGTVSKLCT